MFAFLGRVVRRHFEDPAYFAERYKHGRRASVVRPEASSPLDPIERMLDQPAIAALVLAGAVILGAMFWTVSPRDPLAAQIIPALSGSFGFLAAWSLLRYLGNRSKLTEGEQLLSAIIILIVLLGLEFWQMHGHAIAQIPSYMSAFAIVQCGVRFRAILSERTRSAEH